MLQDTSVKKKQQYSPEYVQTSLAAAISLGLENGSFKDRIKLTGLNLLLVYGEKCIGRCAYCGISKIRPQDSKGKKTFIRVKWPVYRLDEIINRTKAFKNYFERICISMITHPDAVKDTVLVTKKIKEKIGLPISLLISPTIISGRDILRKLKESGADMAGVALDTATEELFKKYRGSGVGGPHSWDKYWKVLEWSTEVFGEFKAGIHLIAGLGETEKQMVETIHRAHGIGAKTHLFSFFPETGSLLGNMERPELASYRRIQIAAYLINEKSCTPADMEFSNGDIISFNQDLEEIINDGTAFMTSGCPGRDGKSAACNRPLANERPSETFRNYPYAPDKEEKRTIRSQIESIL